MLRHCTVFPVVYPCCLTPETLVHPLEFRCYLVYELRYALFPIYFRLMAAIFDLQNVLKQYSIHSILYVLPDPGNVGVAVGISLLA